MNNDHNSLLERIRELMSQHQQKIDSATILAPDSKSRSEGYLEALYQVENILLHF